MINVSLILSSKMNKISKHNNSKQNKSERVIIFNEINELLDEEHSKENFEKMQSLLLKADEKIIKVNDYMLLRRAILKQNEFVVDKMIEKVKTIEMITYDSPIRLYDSPIRLATERKSHNIFKKVIKKSASDDIFEAFLYSLLTDIKIYIDDFFDNIDFENKENLKKVEDSIYFNGQNNATDYFHIKLKSLEDKKALQEIRPAKPIKIGSRKI